MSDTYYLMPVEGSVEPQTLRGPFLSWESLLRAARTLRAQQSDEDALFWIVLDERGIPTTGSFAARDVEPDQSDDAAE